MNLEEVEIEQLQSDVNVNSITDPWSCHFNDGNLMYTYSSLDKPFLLLPHIPCSFSNQHLFQNSPIHLPWHLQHTYFPITVKFFPTSFSFALSDNQIPSGPLALHIFPSLFAHQGHSLHYSVFILQPLAGKPSGLGALLMASLSTTLVTHLYITLSLRTSACFYSQNCCSWLPQHPFICWLLQMPHPSVHSCCISSQSQHQYFSLLIMFFCAYSLLLRYFPKLFSFHYITQFPSSIHITVHDQPLSLYVTRFSSSFSFSLPLTCSCRYSSLV